MKERSKYELFGIQKTLQFRMRKKVVVSGDVLFKVLTDDLDHGLCTDIQFLVDGDEKKHSVGAYGDGGETRHNVRFYLDKQEFASLEELREKGTLELPLPTTIMGTDKLFVVFECNGCYPESTPTLVENNRRV